MTLLWLTEQALERLVNDATKSLHILWSVKCLGMPIWPACSLVSGFNIFVPSPSHGIRVVEMSFSLVI